MSSSDVVVVGAGILGLAVARELLLRRPGTGVTVLEKEDRVAAHQTGRNSGVIHAGIYYRPGSLKAKLCVEGSRLMIGFCREQGIAHELCGKVIVATTQEELVRLRGIHERGVANGVDGLELVGRERLEELEPATTGLGAIWSPGTGIVDYGAVARKLAEDVERRGGEIRLGARVVGFRGGGRERVVRTAAGELAARYVVACCGLYSDRVAELSGGPPTPRIVPFRGRYHLLSPAASSRFARLVYPVPHPGLPFFLGVHLTRQLSGEVWAGPTAVLALAREGYGFRDVRLDELWEALSYRGFRALMRRAWRLALAEMMLELRRGAFLDEVRRLAPWLEDGDLRGGHSGVRAQALSEQGELLDDFWIDRGDGITHVRNAPSPAATSSLAIARSIVDGVERELV